MQSIDLSELPQLASLPQTVRDEISRWFDALESMTPPLGRAVTRIAREIGCSQSTVWRKYYSYRHAGWQALINRTKVPCFDNRLPREFIEHWKSLCQRFQRESRSAYHALVRDWRAGREVPGYPVESDRGTLPPGWSYRNLMRHRPSTIELAATRVGLQFAAPFTPKVFTTRAGLYVGSHYMFDDLWHDHFCRQGAQRGRPMEFHALDVFSGCKCSWGMRLRTTRADGSTDQLKESEMRCLVASLLFADGYSPRGTTLMLEHGTAALREDVERLLFDRTGGRVRIQRSGIIGEQSAVAGMYAGLGKGNFRFKAPLESLGNLIHNRMSDLPAQTGLSVERRPESLHGLLKECDALSRAVAGLRPDRAAMLLWPMLDFWKFLDVAGEIYRRINARTDHDLEGWTAAGLTTEEYRVSADDDAAWLPMSHFLALPEAERGAVAALIQSDAQYSRVRKLSPAEVWTAGRRELTRIPAFVVGEILGPDFAREQRAENGYFQFQDQTLAAEPLRFESRVVSAEGREVELPDDLYKVFLNPFSLDQLFVQDARGRYLGAARRDRRVSRADAEEIQRRCGRVAKRLNDILAPARARSTAIATARIERDAHNLRVLSGQPVTREEIALDRTIRAHAPSNEDIDDMIGPREAQKDLTDDDVTGLLRDLTDDLPLTTDD